MSEYTHAKYVDASAILKLYLEEEGSAQAREILLTTMSWVTARHTLVEVRRALARALDGATLDEARRLFADQWERMEIVELDPVTCERAAAIAEDTGTRTLDALHLAAADRAGGGMLRFLTFDDRQAAAARSLGWEVVGA